MSNSEAGLEVEANPTVQEDSNVDEKTNPLLLSPVVSNLFKFLRYEDLMRARGVCTLWNELGTSVLETRSDEPTIEFTHPETFETDVAIFTYLDMLEGSKLFYSSFRLGGGARLRESEQCRALLETFPETLTKLGLYYDETSTALTSRVLRDILLTKAPFLEALDFERLPAAVKSKRIFYTSDSVELELRSLSFHLMLEREVYSAAFLQDIFKNSPYLKDLTISTNYDAKNEELTILRTMAEHVGQGRVTHLDLELVDDNILRFLQNEDKFRLAPLQVFKAKSMCISNPSNLEAFLNTHKGTLEDLHLGFAEVNDLTIPLMFPIMENLRKLRVLSFFCPLNFGILDYGLQFPKLEVLEYFANDQEPRRLDPAIFSPSSSLCPSLKELELPMYLESPAVLKTIARTFPNVFKLNISAQKPEVMEELWECWPNVEKLAISVFWKGPARSRKEKRKRTLDSVFSGFNEEACMTLRRRLLHGENVYFNDVSAFGRRSRSIANLKNLKYLIIHGGVNLSTWTSERMESKQLMSYLTVMSTLKEMKSLVCFIMEPTIFNISGDRLKMLATELELMEVEESIVGHLVKYDWLKVKRMIPYFYWLTL